MLELVEFTALFFAILQCSFVGMISCEGGAQGFPAVPLPPDTKYWEGCAATKCLEDGCDVFVTVFFWRRE